MRRLTGVRGRQPDLIRGGDGRETIAPFLCESLLDAPGGIQARDVAARDCRVALPPSMAPLKPRLEHVPGDCVAELLTDIASRAEMNTRDDAGILDLFHGR